MTNKKLKIYDTIRFLRQYKGYSQEYMAEQIGIDAVTYGRVETGKIKLTVERLYDISVVLGYNIQTIFELPDSIKETSDDFNDLLNMMKRSIQLSEQILQKIKTN